MNYEYAHLIPRDLNDSSRVWIYQSSRMFSIAEALRIEDLLNNFVSNWNSHGVPVKGYANLFFGRFVILMADETATGVSGCSTDSSVRLIKQIEEECKVNMFDRQLLAFIVKNDIQLLPLSQFNHAIENNFINSETLYFNNLVARKEELLNKWMIPVKESWLVSKIKNLLAKAN